MKLKKIFAVLISSLLVLATVGCGNKNDSETSGGAVGISFWHPLTGPDGATMRTMIAQFNDEHKGKIEVLDSPNNEIAHYSNLLDLIPLNKGPDLAIIHSHRVPEFANNELIQPIDNLSGDDSAFNTDDYLTNVINSLYYNNELYAVPFDVHMIVVYYNKTLLGDRQLPTNRAEFISTAKAVQSENSGVWGLPLSTVWPSEWLYTTALYQNGGAEVDANNYPAFNTAEGEAALKSVADLIHTEKLSQTNLQVDEDLQLFKQGKALFHIQGTWMLESIKQAGFEFGVMPVSKLFVSTDGATSNQIAARSHTFVAPVKRGSEKKSAAIMEFIKWMGDHGESWAATGQIPAKNSARQSESYKALPYHSQFGATENYRLSAPSPYITSGYNPVFAYVTTAMSKSDYNAKSLLSEAASEAKKLVDEVKG